MLVTEKEYKVGSKKGVISVVFKNIFFNDNFKIMLEIVFGDKQYSIGKHCLCLFFLS